MRIKWGEPNARYFETGLDRGVLYPTAGGAVPWNGLTSLDESGNGEISYYYNDGVIMLADVDATDYEAHLSALTYPREFGECLGLVNVAEGLLVDNQKPKRFHLSYRTLVGSGLTGDMFGYQIHLVYNAMAKLGTKKRATISERPEPLGFDFDIVATPVQIPGYRPSAHYIIDTRDLVPETIAELEGILYGTNETSPRLPTVHELFDMMSFGDEINVYQLEDGFVRVTASRANLFQVGPNTFQVNNINATSNGDGTWDVTDGNGTHVHPLEEPEE